MRNFILFLLIIVAFNSCSLEKNIPIDGKFSDKKIYTFDGCTNFSYISNVLDKEYGKIFIEYVDLDISCKWNGFQRGYFDDLFKSTLKLKSFKALERIDYKNYEFSTYIIDDKYYLNVIYQFGAKDDYFLIDYSGKYFDEIIKKHIPNYDNKYLNKARFDSNYKNSLVNMNLINHYFSVDRDLDKN